MNLPAIVAMVGLVLLAANEVFTAWNVRRFSHGKDFPGAVARKAWYRSVVLGITFVCAALTVYSSVADKAGSDAEVAALNARLLQAEDRLGRLAAVAQGASGPQQDRLDERLRRLESGSAARDEVQALSARVDVINALLKQREK